MANCHTDGNKASNARRGVASNCTINRIDGVDLDLKFYRKRDIGICPRFVPQVQIVPHFASKRGEYIGAWCVQFQKLEFIFSRKNQSFLARLLIFSLAVTSPTVLCFQTGEEEDPSSLSHPSLEIRTFHQHRLHSLFSVQTILQRLPRLTFIQ